jgi:cytochrome c2
VEAKLVSLNQISVAYQDTPAHLRDLLCKSRTIRLIGIGAIHPGNGRLAVTLAAILIATASPVSAQDVAMGRRIFQSQCSICHSPQPGRNVIGPSLFAVVGRHSGRIPGFQYSAANLRSGLTWNVTTLDRYLSAPQQVVPGTLMTYPGLKDARKRADLIAYLATLH